MMALILTSICYQIGKFEFVREIESKMVDYRFRIAPIPDRADSNIVMIAIDDASLKYAISLNQGWPWPREFYAIVAEYFAEAGARAVLFDIFFDEQDFDRGDISSFQSDSHFAEAINNSGIVLLSQSLSMDSTAVPASLKRHSLPAQPFTGLDISKWRGTNSPIPEFEAGALSVAGINLLNAEDSVIRKVPYVYDLNGDLYPSLGYAAYLFTRDGAEPGLSIDIESLPVVGKAEMYLNWYGKGGAGGVFEYISFSSILHSAVLHLYGSEPVIPLERFTGKYVIIGAVASGLMDLKSSPYTWGMPGMETWATMLSNLLNKDFVRFLPPAMNFLILYMISLMVILAVSRTKDSISPFLVMLIFALLISLSIVLFARMRIVVELSSSVITLFLSWISILTLSYIMEGKHKKELRQIFNRYLHPDLVNRIVENPELVQMGGEELHCSVMFSDIYNFTGFSEKQTPKQLVSYLNEYFSTFTNSILDHEGLLDKYTGDGLMAVFGAPIPREDHAVLACRAALAHRDYSLAFKDMENLSPSQAFHLNTRLGINSGMLVAGNIGSERRMEYTSIGDTVNLAARLEGVNKVFKTNIIISESTFLLVKDLMLCRELDYLRVKGKEEPTRIYELLCEQSRATEYDYSWIGDYANALELYRKGDWEAAGRIFASLSNNPINDHASATMSHRCEFLIQNPPSTWDGILILEEK